MKIISQQYEIAYLLRKVDLGEFNLQPDFQRTDVWNESRKKKLIDTILREWFVPPLQFIQVDDFRLDVLDGQQRLAAIVDFMHNKFSIDGRIEPLNDNIIQFSNFFFDELPNFQKKKILSFQIGIIILSDYDPEEPAELFYRLNQSVSLTSAEQRNAFYGPARETVKRLADLFEKKGFAKSVLGFSNSRMAYDDIISRLLYCIDISTLRKKISSEDLSDFYRSGQDFRESTTVRLETAINVFITSLEFVSNSNKFNKATLFSWLLFTTRAFDFNRQHLNFKHFGDFIVDFELHRNNVKHSEFGLNLNLISRLPPKVQYNLIVLYNLRVSSGSTDASSIIIRDIIIWLFYYDFSSMKGIDLYVDPELLSVYTSLKHNESDVNVLINHAVYNLNWGEKI
jgi:hypothetical protein